MTTLVAAGTAIEGSKIEGSSRRPLVNRGMTRHNGIRCYKFVASMNIKASITEQLPAEFPKDKRLDPDAETTADAETICDKAIVHSTVTKYHGSVAPGSATHNTNHWSFRKQTLVSVERTHNAIQGAIAKRDQPQGGFIA
jgi:hypothetical protein